MSVSEKYLGMKGPESALFWGVITLGALVGALILYPFNVWKIQRGFCWWPVHLLQNGEREPEDNTIAILTLRNAWEGLLLSFALLGASIILVFSSVG